MNTQIVYTVISTENDYFLEELWVSVFSLRQFHPDDKVVVMTDAPTAARISERPQLKSLITVIKVIPMPEAYDNKHRAREIKTNIRNLIDGDFLFIDTDTVICKPLDEVDTLSVKNLAMVPELHGPFKKHFCYEYTYKDIIRIFGTDCSDSKYWFNSGCMLVIDNELTRKFFADWKKNWTYSAFEKHEYSDQRPLLKTDQDYGYIIECLPDVYNCQVALSMQYFYDAKIVHFWHIKDDFFMDLTYSPFTSKYVYKQVKEYKTITPEVSNLIVTCKHTFTSPSMIVGRKDIEFLMSPFNTVLGRAYREGKLMHWILDKVITFVNYYLRVVNKLKKNS